jgi:uncharacterized protein DUF6504
MADRFIGEDLKPVIATCDTSRMAAGEPGLPREFIWRGQTVTILAVRRTWHETSQCHHGSPEQYVSKHWYEVETVAHGTLKIYFDRQPPRRGRRGGSRWRLFSCSEPAAGPEAG